MDSFALAQDSDDEQSKRSISPNASLTNLYSMSSIEERPTLDVAPPPPPLEPEIIVSQGVLSTSPAVLPDEVLLFIC